MPYLWAIRPTFAKELSLRVRPGAPWMLFDVGTRHTPYLWAIRPTFAKGLGFRVRPGAPWMLFDVGAQNIDATTLDTYGMIVAAFSVTDKANRLHAQRSSRLRRKAMPVTYELHPDIKWCLHPGRLTIAACVFNKSRDLVWASSRVLEQGRLLQDQRQTRIQWW